MEPYVAKKMPYDFNIDKNIYISICNTREILGEYKGYLKSMPYDYKYFLESAFISDVFYSFKIDNLKITKEDFFFMPYKIKNNTTIQFNNTKAALLLGLKYASGNNFSLELLNKLNKLILNGCKKDNLTKGSGKLRKIQTYILKPGIAGSSVSFVPPVYTELNSLMKNLCQYINENDEESFIKIALTHFQFEKIHPYTTANGRLGRLLLPIQLSYYKKETPILFISQAIENLKNTYFTLLSESEIDPNKYIHFILECINDQCNINIKKIKKLSLIYKNDLSEFEKTIGGSTIYKVYPLMIKKIVFTTNDIVKESKLHINSVNKVLNKLVESGYLIKEKRAGCNRVTFVYKNMYDVFME